MADNKKSFILYCDLISMVGKLPDETAGKLFKTILEYVNDKNPEPDDILLQIAFEPIKQQLKRDLKKWQDFRKKQAQNGKLGGRPRRQNLTEGEKAKETQKTQALISEPNESQKSLNANVSVNGNDSVNGNAIRENVPAWEIFLNYAKEKKPLVDQKTLQLKYDAWKENGWKTGKDKLIKNWKSTLLQTLPHLPERQKDTWGN